MLVLLPPSRSHCDPPSRGRRLRLEDLSFPAVTATRVAVLDALAQASAGADAAARFAVSPKLLPDVRRNVRLSRSATVAVERLYTGVLYDALDLAGLDSAALRRARRRIVVSSALWGAVRLSDRVPVYRLSMDVALPPLPPLAQTWRAVLGPVLTEAAGAKGLVVDCRSADYAASWPLTGALAARSVAVRVLREGPDGLSVVSHLAKQVRGLISRQLMIETIEPRSPKALANQLGQAGWQVELAAPSRPGATWRLDVVIT